jgi:hypothetical protein
LVVWCCRSNHIYIDRDLNCEVGLDFGPRLRCGKKEGKEWKNDEVAWEHEVHVPMIGNPYISA